MRKQDPGGLASLHGGNDAGVSEIEGERRTGILVTGCLRVERVHSVVAFPEFLAVRIQVVIGVPQGLRFGDGFGSELVLERGGRLLLC